MMARPERVARRTPTTSSRTEEIAAALRDEVLRGQYRPGERLPSERDLATRFETSRGTVREAFKKLEQLGIVSIQPGGARVVPVEHCTLDVLGPLLDLGEVPDPTLVDQVLHVFGVLLDVAARAAVEKASPEDLERACRIAERMCVDAEDQTAQPDALRELAELFIEVADHLVLRLVINGLRTTFLSRMRAMGAPPKLDGKAYAESSARLLEALERRDPAAVGEAMRGLNGIIREAARQALERRQSG